MRNETPNNANYEAQQSSTEHGAGGAQGKATGAQTSADVRSTAPQRPQEKPKKKAASFYVAIAIALIAAIAIALLALQTCSTQSGSNRDPNQEAGQLEGKSAEEVQAELDRIVAEGMFNISIAATAEFADGTSEGELQIENVPGNQYLMQVTITRNDTGDVVYESGIIEPNHHIQKASLSKDLDAGAYPCTATFTALDPETEEQEGQAAAELTIVVRN